MGEHQEITILIAGDDHDHAERMNEQIKAAGFQNTIIRFADGKKLWDFLSGTEERRVRAANQAYLLLLDFKMPHLNGIEILEKIKNNQEMKGMPVIMLATNEDARELEACHQLGCNAYITKPFDSANFIECIKKLGLMLGVVNIPTFFPRY